MTSSASDALVVCVDVDYRETVAVAAGVWFRGWTASEAELEVVTALGEVAPYQPGEFYRRELPCVLAVLERGPAAEVVVVDGYVWLGPGRAVWGPICTRPWASGRWSSAWPSQGSWEPRTRSRSTAGIAGRRCTSPRRESAGRRRRVGWRGCMGPIGFLRCSSGWISLRGGGKGLSDRETRLHRPGLKSIPVYTSCRDIGAPTIYLPAQRAGHSRRDVPAVQWATFP